MATATRAAAAIVRVIAIVIIAMSWADESADDVSSSSFAPCSSFFLSRSLPCSFTPFLRFSFPLSLPFSFPPFLPRSLLCSFALLLSSLAAPLPPCPLARCGRGRAQTSIHIRQERVGRSSSVGRSDMPPEKDTGRYQVPGTTGRYDIVYESYDTRFPLVTGSDEWRSKQTDQPISISVFPRPLEAS